MFLKSPVKFLNSGIRNARNLKRTVIIGSRFALVVRAQAPPIPLSLHGFNDVGNAVMTDLMSPSSKTSRRHDKDQSDDTTKSSHSRARPHQTPEGIYERVGMGAQEGTRESMSFARRRRHELHLHLSSSSSSFSV